MTQSASTRRTRTSHRVTTCAQRLTEDRGLDGFTMDDLAEAAEVSRRTLFNYFPSKVDAVLGEWPGATEEEVATFRAGGPQHDLVLDLRTLVLCTLDAEDVDRADVELGRRILRSNARLMGAVHERYQTLSATIVEHIIVREGPTFDAQRAQIAVHLLAALLDSALDAFLADEAGRPIAHHFDESLDTARSLLGA